jgi:hypothetical protein
MYETPDLTSVSPFPSSVTYFGFRQTQALIIYLSSGHLNRNKCNKSTYRHIRYIFSWTLVFSRRFSIYIRLYLSYLHKAVNNLFTFVLIPHGPYFFLSSLIYFLSFLVDHLVKRNTSLLTLIYILNICYISPEAYITSSSTFSCIPSRASWT